MDSRKTALFGAVIAIAAGLFGANAAQINNNSQQVMTNGLVEGSPIFGHITVVAKDAKGNIFAYRQSDNLITNQGLNCMAYALFRTAATTGTAVSDRDSCGGAGTGTNGVVGAFNTVSGFRFISLGTSSVAPDQTQTNLVGTLSNAAANGIGVPTLNEVGTGTGGTGGTAVGPQVVISVTGLAPSASSTINEAGLFDQNMAGGATGNIFARQTFASITMGSADTLTVTWTITLAHS